MEGNHHFRGTTESQDPEIMKQDGTRLEFVAISTFGLNVLQLDQVFKDDPYACEQLTGRKIIELSPPEVETIVPRPIPSKNIRSATFLFQSRVMWKERNRNFVSTATKKIPYDWKVMYEQLCSNKCFRDE